MLSEVIKTEDVIGIGRDVERLAPHILSGDRCPVYHQHAARAGGCIRARFVAGVDTLGIGGDTLLSFQLAGAIVDIIGVKSSGGGKISVHH